MFRTLKPFTEWGINLKLKSLKNRLWFNIFIRIAVIFAVFVFVLAISNVTFLVKFFSMKQKNDLKEQIYTVSNLNLEDNTNVTKTLNSISENYNFDVEIYRSDGLILYTTHGGQMMDFFNQYNGKFSMSHEDMIPSKREILNDNIIFETAVRRFDNSEFLLCRKQLSDNIFAEIRVQKQLIDNSAAIANEFILIISCLCFCLSIIWVLIFARRFTKPITEMNETTKNMAKLDFKRKITVDRSDEIGQLADSINELSDSLSSALDDLNKTNAKLRDDIELERQLDVMRRGFVANVSHELKTPISIISGYAEGLKLNINSESREAYCDTIIDESNRMNRLVLSILELSRYESGQIPISPKPFDISVTCRDMLNRIFKGKNITTENRIGENTFVYADPMQIEQVLKSLLENAAAHTEKGGTVITLAENKNDKLRISVINTGSHIDTDIMPQIWQSFYRGDKSHKRESSRFGLGLSIVTAVMKLHNCDCGVYNTENGVCFWFELDIYRENIEPI